MNLELLQILLNIVLIFTALYLIFITSFTIGLNSLKEKFYNYNKNLTTKVSVLIAARNEEDNIEKLLESLCNQSYNKDLFEVIIVDDHSTDNTKDIIKRYINNREIDLKIIEADNIGKKAAISQALHSAVNKLVIVTDADCILNKLWIESIVGYYQENDCKMILAPVLLSPAENLFEKMQVLEHISLIAPTTQTS
mgnify:FL=1